MTPNRGGEVWRRLRGALVCVTALATGACASSTAVPRPFPGGPVTSAPVPLPGEETPVLPPPQQEPAGQPPTPSLTAHRLDGRAIAEYALAFRGVPYRLGGADPAGFDCSGLAQYVFAQYGVLIPRVVDEQWRVGDKVKPRDIEPGDLLFFSTQGHGASHVAIALDGGRFVHAPNSAGVVRVEAFTSEYWRAHYLGARRVIKVTASN